MRVAYPHPFARPCCCQVGPAGFVEAGNGPAPGLRPNPNSVMTGTGPDAFAGVVSVNWTSTVICGYEELSTCPTSCFVITGTSPLMSVMVLVTSLFTFGVFF